MFHSNSIIDVMHLQPSPLLLRICKIFHFWRSFSYYELFIDPFCESLVRLGHHDGRLLGLATCLPHKGGCIPLRVLPKDTISKLAGLYSILSLLCRAPSREAVNSISKDL